MDNILVYEILILQPSPSIHLCGRGIMWIIFHPLLRLVTFYIHIEPLVFPNFVAPESHLIIFLFIIAYGFSDYSYDISSSCMYVQVFISQCVLS